MVEPSRLALTTTPSIAGWSAAPTWPWSAGAAPCAAAGSGAARSASGPVSRASDARRMVSSLVFGPRCTRAPQAEPGELRWRAAASVQRLDLDERRAVVAAGPEGHGRRPVVDE